MPSAPRTVAVVLELGAKLSTARVDEFDGRSDALAEARAVADEVPDTPDGEAECDPDEDTVTVLTLVPVLPLSVVAVAARIFVCVAFNDSDCSAPSVLEDAVRGGECDVDELPSNERAKTVFELDRVAVDTECDVDDVVV